MRRVIAALALAATLIPTAAHAAPAGSCAVLIQFYNEGTPGLPGITPDARYGVRLDVQDVGSIVLPADNNGFVRFWAAPDTVIPFSVVNIYWSDLADTTLPHEAGCGFTAIAVPAGS